MSQPNPTLHPEEAFHKLVALDTTGLCAHLTLMVTDSSKFKRVLAQRGAGARSLLNLLQAVCLLELALVCWLT